MNYKTKTDIIIFSFSLFVLISSFFLFYLYGGESKIVSEVQSAPVPQVLGESIAIRGNTENHAINKIFMQTKEPETSKISAKSWLVYDSELNQVLSKKNSDQELPIASLTKLITGLVAYDNLDFNSTIKVNEADQIDVAPILNLKAGDEVKVNDLFDAMIIGSANDAAEALADHTELAVGRRFTDLMNDKAAALGMLNSHFSNPLGFDLGKNYSTAADLKLAVDASRRLTVFSSLGRRLTKNFFGTSGGAYKINSTNKLIKTHPELEAIKTGYTETSKGSLIVKADFQGHEIIYIILGSENRENDFEKLQQEIQSSYALTTL